MTRVVVTGASGFVGQRVCARLIQGGHEVVAVTRDARAPLPSGIARRVCIGDLHEHTDWRDAFAADDAVVHLAARAHQGDDAAARADFQRINVDGARGLARATVAAGVAQIVYVSSAKVFGEHSPPAVDGTPHAFTAADRPAPVGPYGESKLAAEQLLEARCRAAACALTILRPPLVYGPGNKANLRALLGAIERGWPLPFASIRNRRSLVYVDNLADAIARAIETASGFRRYAISDIDVSTPDLVRALATGIGREARLLPCPTAWLRLLGRLTGRVEMIARLTESMVLDRVQIGHELDWQAPHSFAQGMRAVGDWFRGNASCP